MSQLEESSDITREYYIEDSQMNYDLERSYIYNPIFTASIA